LKIVGIPWAIADGLLAAVLAPVCAVCGRPLEAATQSIVCVTCWASVRPLTPPFCAACGGPLESWRMAREEQQCARCGQGRRRISRGRTLGLYEGVLREILHALKYGGRRTLARSLSRMMRLRGRAVLAGADLVVPVPLHWRRRWARGFNQAADLAAGLGPPVVHALVRTRSTRPQIELPADRRRANVRGAFRAKRKCCLSGAVVVLVDDVSTTGATLDACAAALFDAGAAEVRALTAARASPRPPAARRR
jgi:ComF family protein